MFRYARKSQSGGQPARKINNKYPRLQQLQSLHTNNPRLPHIPRHRPKFIIRSPASRMIGDSLFIVTL